MAEFKTILLNDNFTIAYYSKKINKEYATLKCKIKKELPDVCEVRSFIDAIEDFYDNKIDTSIKYKIKLDTLNIGFIGFGNIYECVNSFRTEKSLLINKDILIDSTIFISNSKLKYLLETIFILLKPLKPIHFKCTDNINEESLDNTEKTDINNALENLFGW